MQAEPQPNYGPCCPHCGGALARPQPEVKDIIRAVARYAGLKPLALTCSSRLAHVVHARHLAIWITRHLRPDLSLPEIGRYFGGRNHSTVLHAIRRCSEHMGERDPAAVWWEVITNE